MVLHNTKINPFDTLEEATKLLSVISQELADRLILIGGQALLLWGEYYLIDKLTGMQLESLASDDLDFMGRKPEVEDCAIALSVEYGFDFRDAFPVKKIASVRKEITNKFLKSVFAKYHEKVESRKVRRQSQFRQPLVL